MAASNHSRLSPVSVSIIILISVVIPLCASVSMAARFLSSLGQGVDSWVLFLVSGAIIFSSVALGHLIGLCIAHKSPVWVPVLCSAVWLLVVTFSTSTSALSLLNSSGDTINRQIQDSPQNRSIQESIDLNIASIRQLQDNINNAPTNWLTKRGQWSETIADLQRQNRALINSQARLIRSGDGSATADAFNKLSAVGLDRFRLSMLAAILMDLIPFTVSLAMAFIRGRGRSGKKQSGTVRNLKAVA